MWLRSLLERSPTPVTKGAPSKVGAHTRPNRWRLPLAASAAIAGLAIIGWSLIGLRVSAPPQETPVVSPVEVLQGSTPPLQEAEEPDTPVVLYPVAPVEGEHLGTISLPSLDLHWPIFEGTSEEQLARGVGHFSESVLPGIRDNSVLSSHRTTVFRKLGDLVEGDLIVVETSAGIFTYEVRDFRVVDKTAKDVIVPTETAVLTLTTCFPFYSPIPTTQAFIVTADLVDSAWADHVTNPDLSDITTDR